MSAEPRLPVVFMFSGQGSQYYGMGKELFDSNEVFRTSLLRLDAVVREHLGESVVDRVFDPAKPRNHPLDDTRITHPAIVMIELALAETLRAEGIEPAYVLGSSLGEYAAAVVAGSLSADDCLRVLVRQAGIMAGSPRGGMLAVLAGPEVMDTVTELGTCEVAARNYPGNFVVAAGEAELAAAEAELRAADVLHLRLPVEYAFHSRLLDPVVGACRSSFEGVALARPRIPWVSCASGGLVEDVTAEHFWHAARRTIDFERAMAGLRARRDFLYLDLGPSGSLYNFVRALLPAGSGARSLPLLSQFAKDTDLLAEVRTHAASTTPRKAHGMKVYGFPGQGSQRRGMGRELFARFPAETAIADEVLGYSIEELCVSDPQRRFGRTEFTQPALYVVGALSYLDRLAEDPVPPDHVIGHSLGEYVALFAAGVFDFATGLRLVRRRGELMAAAGGGAMAAVVGVDEATVTRVLTESDLGELDLGQLQRHGPVRGLRPRRADRHGLRSLRVRRCPHGPAACQRPTALAVHAPGGGGVRPVPRRGHPAPAEDPRTRQRRRAAVHGRHGQGAADVADRLVGPVDRHGAHLDGVRRLRVHGAGTGQGPDEAGDAHQGGCGTAPPARRPAGRPGAGRGRDADRRGRAGGDRRRIARRPQLPRTVRAAALLRRGVDVRRGVRAGAGARGVEDGSARLPRHRRAPKRRGGPAVARPGRGPRPALPRGESALPAPGAGTGGSARRRAAAPRCRPGRGVRLPLRHRGVGALPAQGRPDPREGVQDRPGRGLPRATAAAARRDAARQGIGDGTRRPPPRPCAPWRTTCASRRTAAG